MRLRSSFSSLLIAKRIDGVEERSFSRRVHAKGDSYQPAEENRYQHHVRPEQHGPLEIDGQGPGGDGAQSHSQEASSDRQGESFNQKLRQNVDWSGPDRHANADLARALGHA